MMMCLMVYPGVCLFLSHRYSVSTWQDKLSYYKQYIQGHIDDCTKRLNMPLLLGEFGPFGVSTPFGTMDKRNDVYSTTYNIMLNSARTGGSGAGNTEISSAFALSFTTFFRIVSRSRFFVTDDPPFYPLTFCMCSGTALAASA